jgi:molecular chaperone GrpE
MEKEKKKLEGISPEKDSKENKESCSASLEEELERKNKEYTQLWDKYLRLYAEFDNARKRWEKEKQETIKLANFSLIKELIVILDEMEQGLRMAKDYAQEKIYKGLEIMYNNFFNILKKRGLKKIETRDKFFDPHLHEIVTTKELEKDCDKPKILEEVQSGYLLEDKVIRPAKVVVGIKKK